MPPHAPPRSRARPCRLIEQRLRHPACALAAAAAIAGLAFLLVSDRVLPLLGGILATLALGCAGPWVAVRAATVAIAWDRRRVRVGERLVASITRRSILPWWRPRVAMRWPDAEPVAIEGRDDRVAIVPDRRGRFPRSAPLLTSSQPFGVVTARRAGTMPEPVIVWPARARVRVPPGLVAAAGLGRETSERITGHSGDSIGARDYRSGDSVRSIHWAHTARRDALVVRERPGTAAAVVRLVVDHRIPGIGPEAARSRELDVLVGIAFALVESWRELGVRIELVWPGREPREPRTTADLTALLDELACLEPLAAGPPAAPGGRPRPVDLEILLTMPAGRPSLAAAVGASARPRHERLWIVVDEASAVRPRISGGPPETILHVPGGPDPVAAVDALMACVRHDPDARRPILVGAAR